MKIVAFEGQGGARLGIVDGEQVIDLNAADSKLPADLGEILARNNGDTKPLADVAKRAPASARKPLAGLTYRLPIGRPGKISISAWLPRCMTSSNGIHGCSC